MAYECHVARGRWVSGTCTHRECRSLEQSIRETFDRRAVIVYINMSSLLVSSLRENLRHLRWRAFFGRRYFGRIEKCDGILISISMSNLQREKWENLLGMPTHPRESGPKCRYVEARSGSLDILISYRQALRLI